MKLAISRTELLKKDFFSVTPVASTVPSVITIARLDVLMTL